MKRKLNKKILNTSFILLTIFGLIFIGFSSFFYITDASGMVSQTESTASDWGNNYEMMNLEIDGDDLILLEGEIVVETFEDVGSHHMFVVPEGVEKVDVLVVGGGGGGGAAFNNSPRYGGGGGAGGLIFEEDYSVEAGSAIPITVGEGGEGSDGRHSSPHRIRGDDGENSSFGNLVAVGGGGGSSSSSEDDGRDPAGDGGSGGGGGGGAFSEGDGGSGIEGQGHDGADGTSDYSGGGGGAGGPGDGVSGGSGQTVWGTIYATGGDGKTGDYAHGTDATDNTGDGGGGSTNSSNGGGGGNGGSGIVIVKW